MTTLLAVQAAIAGGTFVWHVPTISLQSARDPVLTPVFKASHSSATCTAMEPGALMTNPPPATAIAERKDPRIWRDEPDRWRRRRPAAL